MAKDFAFLFKPGDYLRDTQCLSEKAQVAYDRIMCEHMRNICITKTQLNFFTKRLNPDELNELMFTLNQVNGGYEIEWVAESIRERINYSDSRRKNREGKSKKHMKTCVKHMEDESEGEDINKDGIEKEGKEQFEIFRKSYPGSKRGLNTEYSNFQKKHKDWKEIISILSEKLNYQLQSRKMKRNAGGFIPEWKNLQTWINQRCWEEIISIETPNKNFTGYIDGKR